MFRQRQGSRKDHVSKLHCLYYVFFSFTFFFLLFWRVSSLCHQSLSAPFTCSYVHGPTRSAACLAQLVCQRRRVPVRSVYNLLYYGAAAHHVFLLSHAGGDNGISYALKGAAIVLPSLYRMPHVQSSSTSLHRRANTRTVCAAGIGTPPCQTPCVYSYSKPSPIALVGFVVSVIEKKN